MSKGKFISIHFLVMFILVYKHVLVYEVCQDLHSWALNTISRRNPKYKGLFHLPEKYRSPESTDRVILYWKPPFDNPEVNERLCPGYVMTYDQSAIDIAEAVVFHFREIRDSLRGLPLENRNPKQIWIWYAQEPPGITLHNFKKTLTRLNGVFNWTMTYRADSDILQSYGSILYLSNLVPITRNEILQKKTAKSLGIALVSNCASKIRSDVLTELSSYISIDLFGSCWSKNLCRGACQSETVATYKFYFAFENSICKDYISEKFWFNGLLSNAVPVVMGASRSFYEMVAPKKSFIHVDDFSSIRELAQYLLDLSKDNDAYMEFFNWRLHTGSSNPRVSMGEKKKRTDLPKGLSDSLKYETMGPLLVCEKLRHSDPEATQVVTHLDTWWYGDGFTPNNKTISICKEAEGRPHLIVTAVASIYTTFIILTGLVYYCVKRRRDAAFKFTYSINAWLCRVN